MRAEMAMPRFRSSSPAEDQRQSCYHQSLVVLSRCMCHSWSFQQRGKFGKRLMRIVSRTPRRNRKLEKRLAHPVQRILPLAWMSTFCGPLAAWPGAQHPPASRRTVKHERLSVAKCCSLRTIATCIVSKLRRQYPPGRLRPHSQTLTSRLTCMSQAQMAGIENITICTVTCREPKAQAGGSRLC